MKIIVDRATCTGLGLCESIAPDVFEVDDTGDLILLQEEITGDRRADVDAAISGCPTASLRLSTSRSPTHSPPSVRMSPSAAAPSTSSRRPPSS